MTLFIPIWFFLFCLICVLLSAEALKVCAALELERRKLRVMRMSQKIFENTFFWQRRIYLKCRLGVQFS